MLAARVILGHPPPDRCPRAVILADYPQVKRNGQSWATSGRGGGHEADIRVWTGRAPGRRAGPLVGGADCALRGPSADSALSGRVPESRRWVCGQDGRKVEPAGDLLSRS